MQIEIDPISEVPLYQQLRDRVVEGIAAGELRPGDRLTPIRQLAEQFGINIATVGRGYDLLRAEGLVQTNRTVGSVIASGPYGSGRLEPGTQWAPAAKAGWSGRLVTLLAEAVAQGESDEEIRSIVAEVLDAFAAARRAGTPGTQEHR